MFNSWYKHDVRKNWFKNLEYSLWITLKNGSAPIRRHAIIITNSKLDFWHMYASTGCNEFVDDNDKKYFVNAEKYRYAWNTII